MKIERVQRWVLSSLTLTVMYVWAFGMVLGGVYTLDTDRAGDKVAVLVLAGVIGLIGMIAVRIINQARILSPWLLVALLPPLLGVILLNT